MATSTCVSLGDCPFGEVCNQDFRVCMPEPSNRFLGTFECIVDDSDDLGLSEVVGRVDQQRWPLSGAFCVLNTNRGIASFGFFSALSRGTALTVRASIEELENVGGVALGPYFDAGLNAAELKDHDRFLAFGRSAEGRLEIRGRLQPGERITGYLDVTMLPSADAEARFGAACPMGLAECGMKTSEVGGVPLCTDVVSGTPMCTTICEGASDCSLGGGVCVLGLCTRTCSNDTDCAPLRCYEGDPGEPNGCF
ncbi:MAG: hypothetical protein KIT72_16645 [Polyangiaceae bacterium]|nr:hypothetical protein [Polyangiaceae bacterium]MCW5792047.1 hypothetical protein [Polyangiaceae bacterium]